MRLIRSISSASASSPSGATPAISACSISMTLSSRKYFAIPYRNTAYPAISLWELREVKRRLTEAGHQAVDEAQLFAAYNRLKAIEEAAVRETKAVRRKGQRQRLHATTARPLTPHADTASVPPEPDDTDDIEPFDDLEELD